MKSAPSRDSFFARVLKTIEAGKLCSDFFDPFFVEHFVENYQITRDKKIFLEIHLSFLILSCVATSVLRMRLLHVFAFSKKLRWLAQTKVITLKTQLHASLFYDSYKFVSLQ